MEYFERINRNFVKFKSKDGYKKLFKRKLSINIKSFQAITMQGNKNNLLLLLILTLVKPTLKH